VRPARTTPRTRSTIAAATAGLLVVALLAAPVGAFEEMNAKGVIGIYSINDSLARAGVVCLFENGAAKPDDELDRIRVRSLKTLGPKAGKTWVGYRFSVLRRLPPSTDYEFVFKSGIRKQRASASKATLFRARTWTAPEDVVVSDYRVLIDLFYYARGSRTRVRGKVRGVMEVHEHKLPGESAFRVGKPGDGGECFYNFWT
jgi:hypothetical protein